MINYAWNTPSLSEAISVQNELSRKIVLSSNGITTFDAVAGIDLAYWKVQGKEYAVCCVIVLEQKTKRIVESQYAYGKVDIPYIPGCLAFRELPLILETIKKLDTIPDLYMFDGNGYLHPRHMGIATHASFYLKKPTIGVAKNYYKINDVEFRMPPNEKSAYTDIVVDGEIYGRVLRTLKDVKPIFISVGNYIDLDATTRVVCDFINEESHIPLPTRLADIETHKMRKELQTMLR
ncbi:endonuclease V [Enterocloster clostridioformis]|nr:endonuclease V [uncultured Anaerostipes sp.]